MSSVSRVKTEIAWLEEGRAVKGDRAWARLPQKLLEVRGAFLEFSEDCNVADIRAALRSVEIEVVSSRTVAVHGC